MTGLPSSSVGEDVVPDRVHPVGALRQREVGRRDDEDADVDQREAVRRIDHAAVADELVGRGDRDLRRQLLAGAAVGRDDIGDGEVAGQGLLVALADLRCRRRG